VIDRIYMNSIIPLSPSIYQTGWRCFKQLYYHDYHGLRLFYSPSTQRLIIKGRLILLSAQRDRVTNLDTPWRGIADVEVVQIHSVVDGERQIRYELRPVVQDLESLILEINADLSAYLQVAIDIREFQVTYIEFTFNVFTDHVEDYITLFNQIFAKRNPARYKNYVIEHGMQPYSSFYVKSNKQFESRKKFGTTANLYCKQDWLEKELHKEHERTRQESARRSPRKLKRMTRQEILAKEQVPLASVFGDESRIQNCLRLEVQYGSSALYRIFGSNRLFSSFLDIDLCRVMVIREYEHFIGSAGVDFYSYARAKEIIESSPALTTTKRNNLLAYLKKLGQGLNAIENGSMTYNKHLSDLGIHWNLLPRTMDHLPSPMKLLRDEVEKSKALAEDKALREEATFEEVILYKSIEETE